MLLLIYEDRSASHSGTDASRRRTKHVTAWMPPNVRLTLSIIDREWMRSGAREFEWSSGCSPVVYQTVGEKQAARLDLNA